jgi:acyl transferase domain-containing protein
MSRPENPVDQSSALLRAYLAIEELEARLDAAERAHREPIAIVGMGCRFPGGVTRPDAFWRLLRDGVDTVGPIPPDRWDVEAYYDPHPEAPGKMYTRHGAFLDDVFGFDPQFFGISPREAVAIDPQQRLILETGWEALEDAGLAPDRLAGSSTGVYVGLMTNDYLRVQDPVSDPVGIDAYTSTGTDFSFPAGRLSYVLGLQGPSVVVSTACSSSLVTVHLACQALRAGECDLALAGGVSLMLSPDATIALSRIRAISPDGRSKSFDASADGYGRGEGGGMVVLKRLADARASGDRILALVRGSAINHDGPSGGLTVPNGLAQEALLRSALANAGVTPADIGYVEAHGTGTALGDPIEVRALAAVLGTGRPAERPLAVGSVKTNIGHLESAAGIAGLIKAVLCLRHREIPPHLHLERPNPLIPWSEIPLRVPTEPTPWLAAEGPRLAGVSAFGLSGINAHVVLEEAPAEAEEAPRAPGRPLSLLALSAKSEAALREMAESYADHLAAHPSAPLGDFCFSANAGRAHFAHRLALVAASPGQVREQLAAFAAGGAAPGLLTHRVEAGGRRPKIAFLFTGQGSQYTGMGRQLFDTQPTFRRTLERCDELLRPHLERPLLSVIYPEPGSPLLLDETAYTQPALFALQIALTELWRSWGIEASAVLGHSVGELAAACVAGALSLEDGLRLAARRGALMQALPREGAMVSIAADEQRVAAAVAPWSDRVSIAALNGPTAVVVSGDVKAVGAIADLFRAERIEVRDLKVSHAFHSPLMEPMLDSFERVAAEVEPRSAEILWISNLTGRPFAPGETPGPAYWRRHAREPVRFAEGIRTLREAEHDLFLEIGPRATLLALGSRCLREGDGAWLPSLRHGQEDWQQMLGSLASLYVHGAAVDWAELDRGRTHSRVALPTYPFQRQRYVVARRHRRPGAQSPGSSPLGRRLRAPLVREAVFESELGSDATPLLAEHRIYGTTVVPGAWFLTMALAAAGETFGPGEHGLEEVTFSQALVLPDGETRSVQIVLDPAASGEAGFRIISLSADDGGSRGGWTLHAAGRLRAGQAAAPGPERAPLSQIRERCRELPGAAADFYETIGRAGLELGAGFRWLERIFRGEGEALAELGNGDRAERADGGALWPLHPGLIDSCFQLLGAALRPPEGDLEVYVPIALEGLRLHGRPGGQVWAHAVLRPGGAPGQDTVTGDLRLVDEQGAMIAEILGVSARRAPREILLQDHRTQRSKSWLYELDWLPKGRPEVADGAALGGWLVLADAGGVGSRLAQELQERGGACATAWAGASWRALGGLGWQLDPQRPEELERLLAEIGEEGVRLRGVVYLWGLDARGEEPWGEQAAACGGALHLVQALARRTRNGEPPRLWLVTRGAQAVAGGEAVSVAQAPLWGLGGVVAQEHAELWGGLVDLAPVDSPREVASLADEVSGPDGEDRVAFRDGRRHVARLERWRPGTESRPAPAITAEGSYLVTGGLGGLGLVVARWLAGRGARHLVLVGRRAATETARRKIADIEALGAEVVVARADVSLAGEVKDLLAGLSGRMPPLRGVMHAAGVLDDGLLLQADWQRFARVLAPKVAGAWNLHRETRELPLDFFVLFSSAASLLSPMGQGNYAAGNAFLDALAHHRRTRGLPGLAVNWGPWSGAGMAAGLGEREKRRWGGMGEIAPERGLELLERLLGEARTQAAVLPVDWSRVPEGAVRPLFAELVREARPRAGESAPSAAGEVPDLRRKLADAPPSEHPRLVAGYVREQALRVLGIAPAQPLDFRQPLQELGLDSLMAIELKDALSRGVGGSLPATLIFDHHSVEALSAYLLDTVLRPESAPEAAAPAAASSEEDGNLLTLLASLEELSEDEAQVLLSGRLRQQGTGEWMEDA